MNIANVLELYDGVYTSKYAYYSPRYRDAVRNKAQSLAIAFAFLHKILNINKRTWMLISPVKQYKNINYYGYMEKQGNIIIDPRFSIEKIVETIAHEMWHVKQLCDGYFQYTKNKKGRVDGIVWKGHTYKTIMPNSHDIINAMELYKDQPWEKEACENERLLAKLAMSHVQRHNTNIRRKKLDKCAAEVYIDNLLFEREKCDNGLHANRPAKRTAKKKPTTH